MFFIYCIVKILLGGYTLILGVLLLNSMTCKIPFSTRAGISALTAAAFADLYYLRQWDGVFDQHTVSTLLTTIGAAFLLSRFKVDYCILGDTHNVFRTSKN